ncbi:MAG: hypothetical protein P1V36_15365, partial [Planctomycetota bacterium]|nr:hypothetical protein [Planctomycetota bacterium]
KSRSCRHPRRTRVPWGMRRVGLALLALLLTAAPLRAEDEPVAPEAYEETELRLKTAGIDEAMREEIHAAIRKGVAVLRKLQMRNGSILGNAGQTVLGGLALTHAGIPEGEAGGRAAMAWVLRKGRKTVAAKTYEASIAAMLFESLERTKAEQKYLLYLHALLRRAPRSDLGYWGYRSSGSTMTPNLSTAQFAALGLWAAERAGAKPDLKMWKLHLDTLLKAQTVGGSWGYYAPDDPGFDSHPQRMQEYPTGTFMGIANVAVARQALQELTAEKPEYDARIRIALARGKAALRRHAQWVLTAQALQGLMGHYPYYRLFALEKACLFLDLEDVGGVRWYREGARWLLDQQLPGAGGWSSFLDADRRAQLRGSRLTLHPQAQHTAFALLFLLRATAAYHPVTPRPVGRAEVTTPSGDAPAPDKDDAPITKAAPPLLIAQGALARLEKALAAKRLMRLRPVLDAMRLVGRIYRSSRSESGFASPGHEVWARRVDETMLQLAGRFRRAKANDRLLWQAVGLAALDAMPNLHARIAPRLMQAVLAIEHDKAFAGAYPFAWYGTAMEALRRIAPPGLAIWLGERALASDPELWWRSSTAMTALGGLAPALPGRQRHGAARAVWRHLEAFRRRSAGNPLAANLMRDIQVLMHRLASPAGEAADLPPIGGLDPKSTLQRLEAWWRQHDKPDDPLWR